jgi:hypothetical protein
MVNVNLLVQTKLIRGFCIFAASISNRSIISVA